MNKDTQLRVETERLRANEMRFGHMIMNVKDYAIFLLDPMGNVASWNEGAERIKGYKADEIIGKHFSTFYPQEEKDRKHPDNELQIAKATGRYEEEGWRVRKDGSLFWANVVITAIRDTDGKLLGFTKITRDLTEKRKVDQKLMESMEALKKAHDTLEERVLERTQKLRKMNAELARSNSELEQFAYVASHDLQEPLRNVVTYLQLLESSTKSKLDQEDLESINIAVSAALRMRELIQDLLAYARIGKSEGAFESNDLNKVLDEVRENLKSSIEESCTQLIVKPLPRVKSDWSQMVQLFQNLVGNAIKYRKEIFPLIEIDAKKQQTDWLFNVRDNGLGIKSDYSERIFAVFQRLHTQQGSFQGTGIGLAICKKIVERHGGRIWVESVPGEGSVFSFTLPADL